MNKSLVALLGGTAFLTLFAAPAAASAKPEGALGARSYAELLDPIDNPLPALKADDARIARQPVKLLQLAEHHHHHHHSFFPGVVISPYAAAPEDCYWTVGRPFWNGWRWVRRRVRVCD
jgi:hypothetical protein